MNADNAAATQHRVPGFLIAGLVAAFAGATASGVLALADLAGGSLIASAFTAICIAALLSSQLSAQRDIAPGLSGKVVEQVQAGRKLAIYERETGLFAHWYVALRGEEECQRAARYERKLTLIVLEPTIGNADTEWDTKETIAGSLQKHLRATDLAGYLGNGRFIVVAPETDSVGVGPMIARLTRDMPQTDVSTSVFPDDGQSFPELWRRAVDRLVHGLSTAA